MCRLYGFRSAILSGVHRSLVAAENALCQQSLRHPDGWGVAYYTGRFPHLIRSDKRAMEDSLFREVSAVVSTRTLLAHIRQATVGRVGVLNCHPFQHGPWTFAHNGELIGYGKKSSVRSRALAAVEPKLRGYILGTTDSEVCFHVFLSVLERAVGDIYHEGVTAQAAVLALRQTIDILCDLAEPGDEPSRLTFMVTNGSLLLAYRHRRELFFSTYKSFCPESGGCAAYEAARCEAPVRDGAVKHLIVTSERISAGPNVWEELADGEYVCVDHAMRLGRGRLADVQA